MPIATCLPTVGEIARRLDEPIHRIEYLIRSRAIKPLGMAGNARVFHEEAIEVIADELRRIDEVRSGGAAR
jgi:hypothetical protein